MNISVSTMVETVRLAAESIPGKSATTYYKNYSPPVGYIVTGLAVNATGSKDLIARWWIYTGSQLGGGLVNFSSSAIGCTFDLDVFLLKQTKQQRL